MEEEYRTRADRKAEKETESVLRSGRPAWNPNRCNVIGNESVEGFLSVGRQYERPQSSQYAKRFAFQQHARAADVLHQFAAPRLQCWTRHLLPQQKSAAARWPVFDAIEQRRFCSTRAPDPVVRRIKPEQADGLIDGGVFDGRPQRHTAALAAGEQSRCLLVTMLVGLDAQQRRIQIGSLCEPVFAQILNGLTSATTATAIEDFLRKKNRPEAAEFLAHAKRWREDARKLFPDVPAVK